MGLMAIILSVIAFILLVPVTVYVIECLAALLPERSLKLDASSAGPKTVVLIPAHSESDDLAASLESLKANCEDDTILVVAPPGANGTVEIAKEAGVQWVVRKQVSTRSNADTLMFAVEHLSEAPPDVIVVIDADSRVSSETIQRIAAKAVSTERPIQADVVFPAPETPTPKAVGSTLSMIIRNQVRPTGLRKLGLPCQLAGTGMAFPYEVLRKAPRTGEHLTDDVLFGIELAKLGHAPASCARTEVTSVRPATEIAVRRQGQEPGPLAMMLLNGPTLVKEGFQRRSLRLIASGLDLLVPPVAMLVSMLLVVMAVALLDGILGGGFYAFRQLLYGLIAVGFATGVSWYAFARDVIPFEDLKALPSYFSAALTRVFPFLNRPRKPAAIDVGASEAEAADAEATGADADAEGPPAKAGADAPKNADAVEATATEAGSDPSADDSKTEPSADDSKTEPAAVEATSTDTDDKSDDEDPEKKTDGGVSLSALAEPATKVTEPGTDEGSAEPPQPTSGETNQNGVSRLS